jgi:molybdopterin/thiamine biosynthesis adenylyltransferase
MGCNLSLILQLVVMTDTPWEQQLQVNDWARKNGKKFISADARGLFSYAFVDLGEQFTVNDPDGENCREVHNTFNKGSLNSNLIDIVGTHQL